MFVRRLERIFGGARTGQSTSSGTRPMLRRGARRCPAALRRPRRKGQSRIRRSAKSFARTS
jgi:hypothetical protein